MQLSVVTLILAVAVLREPCTILQIAGAVLMVSGSLVTQQSSQRPAIRGVDEVEFKPRILAGFFFALMAALAYGTSPIIVRQALQDIGALSGLAGGAVAYAAATVAVTLGLLISSLRFNVMSVTTENARWFIYSGIFVAAAHGFLYSALAVAPIMVVAPLLQLSLVFRFLFSLLLNPHHEVFGFVVVLGTIVSILGACAVSIETDLLLQALAVPESLATQLRGQL